MTTVALILLAYLAAQLVLVFALGSALDGAQLGPDEEFDKGEPHP